MTVAVLSSFLAHIYRALFETLLPIRTQRMADHIIGFSAVFQILVGLSRMDFSCSYLGWHCLGFCYGLQRTLPPTVLGTWQEGLACWWSWGCWSLCCWWASRGCGSFGGWRCGKTVILNHNGHFGRFGFPALLLCDLQCFFLTVCLFSHCLPPPPSSQWPPYLPSYWMLSPKLSFHTGCFSHSLGAGDFGQLLSGIMNEKKEEAGKKGYGRKKEENTKAVGAVGIWRRC